MNINEINNIKDYNLREIRLKYWNLRHKAFLDEHGISDQDLGKVLDELTTKEEKEVTEYLKKQEEQNNA